MKRYEAFAAQNDMVLFLDASKAITARTDEFYSDNIHPTPKGSETIASYFAGVLGVLK